MPSHINSDRDGSCPNLVIPWSTPKEIEDAAAVKRSCQSEDSLERGGSDVKDINEGGEMFMMKAIMC